MSRPTFINSQVEYHDNSTEYNIDARGKDINTIMHACEENYTPSSSSPAASVSSQSPSPLFPRITKHAYDKGVAQNVDDELRSASVSAPKLVKALNLNEALGYVDTKNMSSNDLYDMLDECYDLSFKPRCFRNYRSK